MKRRVLLSIIYTLVLYLSAALSQVKVAPLGRTIYEGIFTGNGLLGTMTYVADQNSLRIDIGRTDVYDHRPHSADKLFDKARMSLGHFKLDFGTAIRGAEGREFSIHKSTERKD